MNITSLRLLAGLLAGFQLIASGAALYHEPYRPQFHFTPEKNWMNDPNGMVFYDGEYHLFYQYNPFGDKWGHMSWGHAVSTNMLNWQHLPVALYEADGIMIFSGSAVVDWKNTSGFGKDGKPPMVAIYTGQYTEKPLQNQQIAYSNDRGRTWTKYSGNPVLDIGKKDFRDPKVFWHEPTKKWVMVVSLPTERKVQFYSSPNLKNWTFLSEFGPAGATKGIWECPDLFPLKVEGTEETRWVLIVNIGGNSVAGGSGCQYFIGEFNGTRFVEDQPAKPVPPVVPQYMQILADFDGENYGDWTTTGTAFGSGPARGTLESQQAVSGFNGRGLVNSFNGGDAATGTLTSPPFLINGDYVNFLIGGGNHPDHTGVALLIEGKQVRKSTGHDDERLDWDSWDVREFRGKAAQIQVFDHHSENWGHISIDQIVVASAPAQAAGENANWVDYAKDFYAAVSWNDVPPGDGRRLWLGWMSNWQYANDVPTSPWRSAMSIPRELTLRQGPNRLMMVQKPVREMAQLRGAESVTEVDNQQEDLVLSPGGPGARQLYEMSASIKPSPDAIFELHLAKGPDEETVLRFNVAKQLATLDRTRSGVVDFSSQFPAIFYAPFRLDSFGRFQLQLYMDTSSLDIFINDGEIALTSLILPKSGSGEVELQIKQGDLDEAKFRFWNLKSVWPPAP